MNRFWLNQTYLRMFLFLSILFTIAFVPYTLFISTKFSSYAQQEINRNTSAKLDQTLKSSEFALDRLKFYGLSMYEAPTIREWLVSDHPDPLLAMNAMNAMTILLANEPFIHKTYLINVNTREIIDSSVGIRSADRFDDQPMLTLLREDRPKVLRYFAHTVGGKTHLALVVPSTPINAAYNGYLVMLLDNDVLHQTLLQFNDEAGIEVAIVDEQDQPVLASPDGRELLLAAERGGKAETSENRSKQEEWSLYRQSMESQPWTMIFIARTGEAKGQIVTLQRQVIISSLALLALLNLLLYWISRRSYRPFSQLATRLKRELDAKRVNQTPDFSSHSLDYKVIQQGMDVLIDTVDNMVYSMRNHQEVIDSEYLHQWIMVGVLNEPIRNYVTSHFRLLSYGRLRMIVLRIDHYAAFVERYDQFSSRKLMKYGMSNIAKEILRGGGWAAESVDFGGDNVVLLLGHHPEDADSVPEAMIRIAEQIEQWLRIGVVIGISEAVGADSDLRKLYDHSYEMTHLKFITGEGIVFQDEDMQRYLGIVRPEGEELLIENFIQNIKLGELDKAILILEEIMRQLRPLSRAERQFELTVLLHGLMKALKPFDLFDRSVGIQQFLERFRTLDEVQEWLRTRINEAASQPGKPKHSGRKETLALEIRDYVKSRIHDPMLSPEGVGGHFQLSASYVRQVFKDVIGITLSDYILETRLEHVKKLLETTDWPIADIAERFGFMTKSHFYTAFKKMTGRTPGEYRQLHATEPRG